MKILPIFLFIIQALTVRLVAAQDYQAVDFGIRGDGEALNTRSIQAAIDYITAKGGGKLIFTPGNYITGSFYLKSNVTLQLDQGANLLGSNNPFDYHKDTVVNWQSMIYAIRQQNIGIIGKGTINGRGFQTAMNAVQNVHKGIVQDELKLDRLREWNRPENIYFRECKNVLIKDITLRDPGRDRKSVV